LDEQWSNGQWVNVDRDTYTYDASNNRLSDLYESWSNGQWVNVDRDTYTYDASNNRLSDLYESWSNGQWAGTYRYTYTYDASNNRLTDLSEHWWNGQWVGTDRGTYTYDASNNRLTDLSEYWWNGQWVFAYRGTYTYDASYNKLTDLSEHWSNGQWVGTDRDAYTYDAQENPTSFWHYSWLNSSWTPTNLSGIQGFCVYDSAGNYYQYQWGYNFTLTRKLIVTGIPSQSGNVPGVYSLSQNYPNPFNPSTTIKFELPRTSQVSLTVYDILGRVVSVLVNERRDAGVHEVKCDAVGLASGVYFYRLVAGSFVQTCKMVLIR
jgi:hypothetical protein